MTKYLGSFPDLGSGGSRLLHPSAQGEDLTLSDDLFASGGVSVGNTDNPLTGQIKVGVAAGSGYVTAYPGAYVALHVDGSEILFDISGTEALKLLSTGHLRLRNNKLYKARNAADNADLDLIGTNSSNALILGSGLTGVVKTVSSVVSAATLVNADVSASAAIDMVKTQPYEFHAYRSSIVNDVTGNGAAYTVLFNTAVKNEGTRYGTGTGVYTAAATGLHCLKTSIVMDNITAAMTSGILRIVTSNLVYLKWFNPAAQKDVGNTMSMDFSITADMDDNDTAYVTVTISGGAGNTTNLSGTSDGRSFFGGHLIG